MSTSAVVTRIHITVRRSRRILKLSSLLRFALATAKLDPDGKPNLLPTKIPNHCAHNLFRCQKQIRWIVGDGRNHVFMCTAHMDGFWESGHDTKDFAVERVKAGKYLQ